MDPAISPHTMSNSTSKLSNHIYSNTFKMTIQETSQKLTHPLSIRHTSICVKWFSEISKSSRLLVTSRCCPSSGSLRPKVKKRKWFRASNSARSSPVFLLLVDTSSYTKIETEEGCVHLIKRYFVFQLLVVLSSIVHVRCFTQAEHKTKLPIGQHHIHLMMHMFKSKLRWLTKQENGLHFVLKPGISNICLGCKSFETFCPPSLYRSGFGCVFWGLDRCSRNCWGVADKKKYYLSISKKKDTIRNLRRKVIFH